MILILAEVAVKMAITQIFFGLLLNLENVTSDLRRKSRGVY
jgi:hypothetical protein